MIDHTELDRIQGTMNHSQEYIFGLLNIMHEHAYAAGIEWDKVRRNAIKIAKESNNAYDADRAFCDFLYYKQLENISKKGKRDENHFH